LRKSCVMGTETSKIYQRGDFMPRQQVERSTWLTNP
jgi:hypothetical protein